MSLNRTELQQLAEVRLVEAGALLGAGLWDGAYYLAGYAVECALKACILAHVERTGVIFEEKKFSEKCWTHDIEALIELAGLKPDLDADALANPALGTNRDVTKRWNESSRYSRKSESAARVLLDAIAGTNGMLPWIKQRW